MHNEFEVILPDEIKKLQLGFSTYSTNKTIRCKAKSLNEVLSKYPDAIKVKLLKVPNNGTK